jgi:hypothetical protein
MELGADFGDILIEVFDKSEENRKKWYPYEESDESKKVFREYEDDKCDKDRKIDV